MQSNQVHMLTALFGQFQHLDSLQTKVMLLWPALPMLIILASPQKYAQLLLLDRPLIGTA